MKKLDKLISRLEQVSLTSEQRTFFRTYGRLVSRIRRDPTLQTRLVHGLVLPPHERAMLRPLRWDYREYHYVASRGSAKSFTICSLSPILESTAFSRRKNMTLSASKFRGGKIIMEEALNIIMGHVSNQRQPAPFSTGMILHKAGLKRETDRWYIPFSSRSTMMTVPTGNTETIRGLRAQNLFLDEADNWESDTVNKIVKPFLAVNIDFEATGNETKANKIVFVGTVSYGHKHWAKTIKSIELLLKKRYEAYTALYRGDYPKYREMLADDNEAIRRRSVSFQRWDYTDLILPRKLADHDVYYPTFNRSTKKAEINSDNVMKYDFREKQELIYTYPVDKNVAEDELDTGLVDQDAWAAEWRCQFIETSGNVYPLQLVENATESELVEEKYLKGLGWDVEERGLHYPPLLWECSDPCVLGVDPARVDDFASFVVMRIGELANGEYNPVTGTGETPWNNVIWAEQRKGMTNKEIAEKILELKQRYNLIVAESPDKGPAIVIDARGTASGATIRDDLARPAPTVDPFGHIDPNWVSPIKVYDPTDKEYKDLALDQDAWPGLRLLWTSDQINTELVSFTRGQLQTSRLYIAKEIERRLRDDPEGKLLPGYLGVRSLRNQLLSIQSSQTRYHQRFYVPGNTRMNENKKDLFSGFLYAAYALRQHLALSVKKKRQEPVIAGLTVSTGGNNRTRLADFYRY